MIREDWLSDAEGEALWPLEGEAANLLHYEVAADSCDLLTSIRHKDSRLKLFAYEVIKGNNVCG